MNRAVFLDRDGTMVKDVPYCSRPEDLELLPHVWRGIKLLNEAGFKVIVITNQSGIAQGYFTEEILGKIHHKMRDDLAKFGVYVDATYYCPRHPNDNCDCRKPKPKFILQAAKEHSIVLEKTFFIGDKIQDIEAGHRAGCKTVLVSLSELSQKTLVHQVMPDFITLGFTQTVDQIIIPLSVLYGDYVRQ